MLFDNNVSWSRSAVGTWPRFLLVAVFFTGMPFVIIHFAIDGGWRTAAASAVGLCALQLMVLFALRRATVAKRSNAVA